MVIIFLIGHLTMVNLDGNFEILEFYAGAARLAKISANLGGKAAAMDYLFDDGDNKTRNNAMDMNTSAGFLPLIKTCYLIFDVVWHCLVIIVI